MNNDDQVFVMKGREIGPLLGMFLFLYVFKFFMVLKGHYMYCVVSGNGK
jgi:hypothetical protein